MIECKCRLRQQEKPTWAKNMMTGTNVRDESNDKQPRVEPKVVHIYN